MPKYLLLYNSSASASELMAGSSKDQMKARLAEWYQWRDDAESQGFKFEFGSPLQARDRVTPEGVTVSDNPASGHSYIEGESKDTLLKLLKTHPHLQREGATIDVLEMLTMPGIRHEG